MNEEWIDSEWTDLDPDGEWDWEPEDDAAWEELPAWEDDPGWSDVDVSDLDEKNNFFENGIDGAA